MTFGFEIFLIYLKKSMSTKSICYDYFRRNSQFVNFQIDYLISCLALLSVLNNISEILLFAKYLIQIAVDYFIQIIRKSIFEWIKNK
jgi:hypothetical protein